jgi:putative chitinase
MLSKIADAFNRYAFTYGVVHQNDIADFLAHVAVETGGFRNLEENMNYSVEGLKSTFSRSRISADDCEKYGRKKGQKADQKTIANIVYGGEWGKKHLGNQVYGDGWKYRGSGAGQVTGLANFARAQRLTGIDFLSDPELMREPVEGMQATLALWREWDMNSYEGGSVASRKKWNGGDNGLEKYQEAFSIAMKLKLSVPEPSAPPTVEMPSEADERLHNIADRLASRGRASKTTASAVAAGGIGGGIGIANTVVDTASNAQNVAEKAGGIDWITVGAIAIVVLAGVIIAERLWYMYQARAVV